MFQQGNLYAFSAFALNGCGNAISNNGFRGFCRFDVGNDAELVNEGPLSFKILAKASISKCARNSVLTLSGQVAPNLPVHESVDGSFDMALEEGTCLLESPEAVFVVVFGLDDEHVSDGLHVVSDNLGNSLLAEFLSDTCAELGFVTSKGCYLTFVGVDTNHQLAVLGTDGNGHLLYGDSVALVPVPSLSTSLHSGLPS